MKYLLDTDISSFIMKRFDDTVLRNLQRVAVADVAVSAITKSELEYGVAVSPRQQQDRAALDEYLRHVAVLDYPEEAASHYGYIRATLKQKGAMIGANDLFIAAHARSLGLILVTNNLREFTRVPGLVVENWTKAKR